MKSITSNKIKVCIDLWPIMEQHEQITGRVNRVSAIEMIELDSIPGRVK